MYRDIAEGETLYDLFDLLHGTYLGNILKDKIIIKGS